MALKVKDEFVGKRFICFEKSLKNTLQACNESNDFENGILKLENLELKRGFIRAITSKDLNEESHQILVEFDNKPWETREWLTTADQLCLLMVEDSLAWIPNDKCDVVNHNSQTEDFEDSKNSTSHLPALIFRKVYCDIQVEESAVVAELLQSRKLIFHLDPTCLLPFKEEHLKRENGLCEDRQAMGEVEKWWDVQNGQNILLNMPLILVGFRVQVYRTQGTTRWFTAVIRMVNENSQMLIVLDDTVLEEHHVSPSLVQMSLIGEGVVTSLLNGDHVKIRPSRTKNTTNSKNLSNNLEKKRKNSVVRDHPKKRKTISPTQIPKPEANVEYSGSIKASGKPQSHPSTQLDIKEKVGICITEDLLRTSQRFNNFKTCRRDINNGRSLFKQVKQKFSSSSSSSFSSSSSSSSSSSESSESSFKGLDRKISNPVNKINTSNTKALNNVEQCKLAICSQKLDSTTNLISNSLASSKKSLGKLEKTKKSKEKGVIFLTEEEEEFIHKSTCIASPENIIQGKRIFQKTTLKKLSNSGAMQSNKKEFLGTGRVGNVTDDVPVDLSSPASCVDGRGQKKMDNSRANLASEPYISTSGLPSKPVQTVFPTISPQDKTDGAISNFGDKPASVVENISHPLTYGLIDQSARNLIPLGYIPFLPLLNGSVKMVANSSDRSKPGSDVALPTERVAALAESVRLQLLSNADEIHKTHALKTIKATFPGRCDSGLLGKGEVSAMVRDEKNVRLERKEPKFIVHEPEKPGEAVNHHFSKSLQVRHPIGPQSTIVQGMMLTMSPQIQSPSRFIKSSSPHHGHTAVFNPHARPDNSWKANARSSHYFGSESNSIYSAPKPKSCTSNVSSHSSAESLKPTLDLSGNVYLPSVSMLKSPPDAPLTKLQQDQLQEYLKLHAQQFHQLQQQAILPARNQSQGNTSQVNSITGIDETLTPNFLLLSNKLLSNSNIVNDSALSQSKVEISPGVLDLQKKQNSMSANVVSKSNQRPPSMQFWNDKVPPQEQQALLSNSIIVVDYQGFKDRGLVDRSAPSDASRSLSDDFSFALDSVDGETSVVARGKKRSSGEPPPPVHAKKLRISDGFMDVTSLLFCGSERKVTSPQLGLLPQSSSLALNYRLQSCFRATTPDIPSARSLSKEERIVKMVYAEGGSTGGSIPRWDDVKREKPTLAADFRRSESVRTEIFVEVEATTVPSSSAFSEVRHLSGPSADSFLSTRVDDGSDRQLRAGDSEISYNRCMEESLPPTLSASSLKCISSPDSSRDNAIGTDSETRSACSPLMIRSIGGTPTFTSSSEANDSSLAVRSSSVCSSNAPVKFKKAWLKRYDEDSRNDSSSSTENISPNGHAKLIDVGDVTNGKSEVSASKPYDISHQDIMTPSTSAVEDSNDGWTSENEDEEKSVASQRSGACVQDFKPQPRKDLEKGSYECIEKMKGRLRELRVASKRDDPSAILSSQVLNRTSKERRSETLEPFLQDGSCHEVTPRLIKCRECRTIKNKKDRKAPNDFCRFYAFRRLRYISKRHLTVSGFSDLNDVTVPDMELWFPTLPIVGPSLDREVASYLLLHLREPFSKIVKLERMAENWCRKSIFTNGSTTTVWKRAVQGVKEMCDVCDVALFNIHCVCTKCGFAVCISCHKEKVFQMKKMKMLTAENASGDDKIDHFDFSDDSPSRQDALKTKKCKNQRQDDPTTLKSCTEEPADRWLTCHNKQQLHDPHKLMVAQTIPSDVLWFLEELLERYIELRSSSGTRANSLPFLSSAFDRLAVLADVAEKQIQNDENQLESKHQPYIPQNSPFVGAKKLLEINLRGKDTESMGPTSNGIKFQGKCTMMLQKERLLHVTDASSASSGLFLGNFQEHWAKGLPIVASKCNLDMDLWRPDLLYRTLSRSDPNHLDSFSDAVTCRRFWEGFEKVSARVKHNEYGLVTTDARLSPVFTWGSSKDEFRDTLPHQFQNLVESLPIRAYTSESGRFNLTSRLPDFFAKPDLGPRLHVGYGQLDTFEGSLPLKLEGCDVVTLLACVVTPKDDVNNHLSAAEKYLMKIGCGLKLSDTATKPGVVWHVFERQHNDIIEKLIVEKQMKASHDGAAIKSSIYLNVDDLKLLKRDRNVEPITVVQHLDDAVFIPTGCYHQARFLYGCVMASLDVVTPENTSFMLEHQLKSHFNCSDKLQLLNTIYHATKDSLAVAMQSEMLTHCH